MTAFTHEDFEDLADQLRTSSREHNARLIDKQLSLILVALDHMAAPVVAVETWQPIETAPLDGDKFIIGKRDSTYAIVSWRAHRLGDDVLADREKRWRDMSGGRHFSPTHWMAIPE